MVQILSNFKEALSSITPINVIDVLIVAFAIYKVMQMIKETRAGTLIKGIIMLFVVVYLSNMLHLITITYLLTQMAPYLLTALIVIFQPELRRALEMVGRSRFKGLDFFTTMDDAVEQATQRKLIEEVVDAAAIMSGEKVGALIVMERDTKIGEIISTGTTINAEISSELIRNIFFKNSPLHDGAMVIRKDKIAAAGCFLPLSESKTISQRLGTRHRAGLGMSECCDAVVVIVSEETGAISIAKDGVLTHNVSAQALQTLLENVLCPAQKESKVRKLWKGKDNEEKE